MTSIQPQLWVETPHEAVAFYEAAFGATVLHRVGEGEDVVAQLGVGDAAFWVAATSAAMKRLSPRAIDGATSRTLLVVDDPERIVRQAVAARREGIVSREQRARLAARPDHRPIWPRVGDRRASWSLAPDLSGARRSRPT